MVDLLLNSQSLAKKEREYLAQLNNPTFTFNFFCEVLMSNFSNTNNSNDPKSSTTDSNGGVFFRFSIGSAGQVIKNFLHITRLHALDTSLHPFDSLLFHNFPSFLFTNSPAFSLHRLHLFLQTFEKDFLLDSFFKQFSLKTHTIISFFNAYKSSFISSHKSNNVDKNASSNNEKIIYFDGKNLRSNISNLDLDDTENVNSNANSSIKNQDLHLKNINSNVNLKLNSNNKNLVLDQDLKLKTPDSNLQNADLNLTNSTFLSSSSHFLSSSEQAFFHHLSSFSRSSIPDDLLHLPNLLANFNSSYHSINKPLLAYLFFNLSFLPHSQLIKFVLSNTNNSKSLRSHYYIDISFEGKIDTSLARNLVKEYLLVQFPDARFLAAVHQDTEHTHVHVLLLATNIHDKKLYFSYIDSRNLDVPWAKIYSREFGSDKLKQHLDKKSQTLYWKKDRALGINSPKPNRVRHTFKE